MKKRLISLALATVLALGALAGCGQSAVAPSGSTEGSSGSTADTGKKEKIVLDCLHWKVEATDALNMWADEFNKLYPHVTVEFSGADSYKQTLLGRLAANDPPDLICTPSGNYGFDVAKGGHMMDLSELELLSRLRPEMVESQRYNGKIYSIPLDAAAHGVIYNRKVFADLGIEIPKTWAEFEAACQKIKANNIVPIVITGKDDWTLGVVGTTLAAPVYGENPSFDMDVINGSKSYTDAQWVKAMEQYQTLVKNYANTDVVSLDYGLGNQMIANGKAAMVIQGIWAVSAIQQYNPDVDLGVFPLMNSENPDNNCFIWGPDFTIGISDKTPHKEEALAFLDFITTKQGADIWTTNAKTFSAVKDSDMEFNQIAKDINGILATGIKTYPLVNHMWFMDNVWIDWAKSIQELNNGSADINHTLNTLEKSVKDAYAIYSK